MDVQVILGLMAGLGLFLYGMKLMSDGLQKVAGAKLRMVLEKLTTNRLMGTLVGLLFTAVVQSSSATTVLVVSFVNTGLMNLMQASGIIMGANIGTTVTGQLIALNLTAIAPVFLMGGVIMVMFVQKPVVRRLGEVILGFGMLFVGLSSMSGAMETLKESPYIIETISSLKSPMLGVLVGFLVTAVLQSSSATVGIVILMASQGIIAYPICMYLILGCNMGSCVSALLASLAGNKNAKRAAYVHFLINLVGSAVIILVLTLFKQQVMDGLTSLTSGIPNVMKNGINAKIAKDVANTHTIFKIFQIAILFPFTKWIVKLTYLIVPGDDSKDDDSTSLEYIGDHVVYTPATAVPMAIKEIERMGGIACENLNRAMQALLTNDAKEDLEQVYKVEKQIDYLNSEITGYLVKVNQLSLPVADRRLLGGLFHVVNDIERIGDHAENIGDFATTCIAKGVKFSKKAVEEISVMLQKTNDLLKLSLEMFHNMNEEHLQEILTLEKEIDELERKLQRKHVKRLTAGKCQPQAAMIFTDLCNNLERVADHGTNIAFSILEEEPAED